MITLPPSPPGGGSAQDAWSKLSQGRTIGKRVNFLFDSTVNGVQRGSTIPFLQIQGNNNDALQLAITLIPPGMIPIQQFPGAVISQSEALIATGDRTNDDLYLHPPSPIPADISFGNYVCVCEWGIGGVQSKVEVDFSNGLVLNICAAWVRLSAYIDSLPIAPTFDHVIVLGAYVGPGFPKANNAQRTFWVGNINRPITPPGAAGPPVYPNVGLNNTNPNPNGPPFPNGYPIPFFAKQVSVLGWGPVAGLPFSSINNLDCNIHFSRNVFFTELVGTFHFTNDRSGPVIVPNGAYYWTLQQNTAPAVPVQASVVFDLAI